MELQIFKSVSMPNALFSETPSYFRLPSVLKRISQSFYLYTFFLSSPLSYSLVASSLSVGFTFWDNVGSIFPAPDRYEVFIVDE